MKEILKNALLNVSEIAAAVYPAASSRRVASATLHKQVQREGDMQPDHADPLRAVLTQLADDLDTGLKAGAGRPNLAEQARATLRLLDDPRLVMAQFAGRVFTDLSHAGAKTRLFRYVEGEDEPTAQEVRVLRMLLQDLRTRLRKATETPSV